ncbi:hypothetical protein ACIBG8_48210 [Nonomuraea sp. NPDC050556]|uniref:hypothetical protein n=1 Tax=Nonomuraea sp. NPDC050556 TaxID=3364369 RepID=UPI00378AA8F0
MTPLERRYRRIMLAYPLPYRRAHGDELLDVLIESAEPDRRLPDPREAAGLIVGGLRARALAATEGNPWWDGLHLGVTAIAAANLAGFLPYANSLPVWTLLSALALLAVMRGMPLVALPFILVTGAKAVAVASGAQLFDLTLIPVFPGFLTGEALFSTSSPGAVTIMYGLAACCLLALAARRARPRTRSWWWLAAVPIAAWAGPAWMDESVPFPPSLPRTALELAVLGVAVWLGREANDPRWGFGAALYLAAVTVSLGQHLDALARPHFAYWGLLAFLTVLAAAMPYGHRRRALH